MPELCKRADALTWVRFQFKESRILLEFSAGFIRELMVSLNHPICIWWKASLEDELGSLTCMRIEFR